MLHLLLIDRLSLGPGCLHTITVSIGVHFLVDELGWALDGLEVGHYKHLRWVNPVLLGLLLKQHFGLFWLRCCLGLES